ncbi:hybrid-cluster NAD(P)-dependent oxidoreductase [Acidocella aquatica]|uniref:Hybrid-cluster NAD(P)-dependent oxidoreductase n=1 Tax=Acidocella aquatica TaxID=1922313 RepID=A0ABQ6A6H6_9PROT|nr:hybrid-cluster NAD(P)-dependent oxidoreductase [Acidocella aquatica]GLR67253.1 hybrid-cluster NAD(P)-dependent oxidoreductase [Acidocella aquatica]
MRAEHIFKDDAGGTSSFWSGEDDNTLVCIGTREETHDVKTFIFAPKRPALFHFQPGQFITFDFVIGDAVVNRCYTIASSPTRPHVLSITVKRVPGGPVSNWLHETMSPGQEVNATGALGSFSYARNPAEKYLLLSGGSGITPMMSMARAQFDLASESDIVFMHHARTPADIIFRRELELMEVHSRNFKFIPVCEADAKFHSWGGLRGRISAGMLSLAVPDCAEREVFVCGPPAYMRAAKALLEQLDFNMAHYHEESFDFATLAQEPAPVAPVLAGGGSYEVMFAKSQRAVICPAQSTVLDAARAEGMRLPSSCAKGLCGTCKSRLLSGKVEMSHQGGIRQREIDQGMILLCCSKPLSDLVIER